MSFTPPPIRRHFASDNFAGICPEALAAMVECNGGHAPSYGADAWTAEATRLLRELFETDCDIFFVFNGTAANSLALASLCESYESVLCHEHAHIATDECGAPSFFAHGTTLAPLPGEDGKLTPAAVKSAATGRRDVHAQRLRAISLTQSTELGTVYSLDEIAALGEAARAHELAIHMDGARFANAVAGLAATPRAVIENVDVLSFGSTKNGLPFGEAVIFFNRGLARHFEYRRKQSGQLASKMRYIAAPWVGILRDGAWLRHAAHANAVAAALEQGLRTLPGVKIVYPREANAVFAAMPPSMITALRAAGWLFYTDVGSAAAARLMCAWDTTPGDVAAFLADASENRAG